MRRLISRIAAASVAVTFCAAAIPCAAEEATAAKAGTSLTRLSPASRQLLASSAPRTHEVAAQQKDPGASGPSSPSSFFHSTRGKVTLALMGAGAGLTFWSVHHDRQPVKSPIR